MEITREEFLRYEEVRKSGVTNMNLINSVCDLAELPRDKVLHIMKNYSELYDKNIGVEKHEDNDKNTDRLLQ